MEQLATHLALHGAIVLIVSVVGGFLLYRAIVGSSREPQWHLLHAGGTARGIMLIALAGTLDLLDLGAGLLTVFVWLSIFFVWTSTLAMLIAAVTGDRGLRFDGSIANRLVYGLYAVGAVAILPAGVLLVYGLRGAL